MGAGCWKIAGDIKLASVSYKPCLAHLKYRETWCLKAKNCSKTKIHRNGDAQLKFPGRTKLGTLLLNKSRNTIIKQN